ncbi:MAG: GNAT family N-acetyltransferase [Promethearchaeota archaeon]
MVVANRTPKNNCCRENFEYHEEYKNRIKLKDGSLILLRPLKPYDSKKIEALYETFSAQTLHYRHFNVSPYLVDRESKRLLDTLYKGELIIVAVDPMHKERPFRGISELLIKSTDQTIAECSIIISDEWQGKHLGIQMLKWLISIALSKGVKFLIGYFLAENSKVLSILRKSTYKYEIDYSWNVRFFKLFIEKE